MTRPIRFVTVLALLMTLAELAGHAGPVIKTAIEKERVPVDETVNLTVVTPSSCEVEHPFSEKFEVVGYDSEILQQAEAGKKLKLTQSRFSQSSPGVQTFGSTVPQWSRRHTYEIHPLFVGEITVPSLLVTCPDGIGRTQTKRIFGLRSSEGAAKEAGKNDPESILYRPVTLGSPAAGFPVQPAQPTRKGPILAQEGSAAGPPPAHAHPPLPAPGVSGAGVQPPSRMGSGLPAPASAAPPAPGPEAQAAQQARPPEAAAARHADKIARYVQGFAKGFAGAVNGKDQKLASAGKDLASAGKTMASIVKTGFLAAVALLGAAAVVWGSVIGFKAFRRSRQYERLRLWFLSTTAGPQKEENLIGGKYKVLTELGRGGMGTVLLAEDDKLGRKVALKRLHSDQRFDIKYREKLLEEARIISQLNHPYIVGIHEVLEAGTDIYLVFDFVEGRPLSHILHDRKRIPLKECVDIFTNVCQAIDYAHKKNVLHLDIKPSNIMVDSNGFAKLMDFGLARRGAKEESFSGVGGSGTFWYMAPEQHSGVTTPAADLYAIAVAVYEAVTGDIPFKGPDYLRQKDNLLYIPPTMLLPELPPGMDSFIADAFKPRMTERFPGGALEFLERLKALAPDGQGGFRIPAAPPPP
ncbi:MAG: serine/threonine protein kinase [Elusimicrobia bacterium]|nr:serine/threonine protein kinase [Elusimicrobiota bacterium]